jgi:hypothetical protein
MKSNSISKIAAQVHSLRDRGAEIVSVFRHTADELNRVNLEMAALSETCDAQIAALTVCKASLSDAVRENSAIRENILNIIGE